MEKKLTFGSTRGGGVCHSEISRNFLLWMATGLLKFVGTVQELEFSSEQSFSLVVEVAY
jgi:hypothetical protein